MIRIYFDAYTCTMGISNTARLIYLVYFVTHIPITMCVDLQGLFPGFYEGTPLAGLLDWYVATYNDVLMEGARSGDMPWFKSFLFCEALFQLPFFFYASVALAQKINSVRVPMIIYGSHVATTVLAILTEFAYSPALTQEQRLTLFGFYLPYLLVPVALVLDFSRHPVPFGGTKRA